MISGLRRIWILASILAVALVATTQAATGAATEATAKATAETTTPVDTKETDNFSAYTSLHLDKQPHKHFSTDSMDWFHNPAEGLTMTLDTRLRYVYGWNVYLDNQKHGHLVFGRYRNRWGQQLKIDDDTTVNSRLVWEFRTWDEPGDKSHPSSTDFDEIIFDKLNVNVKNFLDMPVTATIGRQDLIYGTGWLVLDGTPLDGSRTIFMDAAKFSWKVDDDTTLDMVYINNHASSNKWLKPINSRDRYLTEQDEEGVILYLTDTSIQDTKLEGYFIYKHDSAVDSPARNFPPALVNAWSKDAEIYTLGGAIQKQVNDTWSFRCEGAGQFGHKEGATLKAFGTKNRLTYSFNDKYNNQLHAEYEYLSGDDESTSANEAFDPLWGEWPQFSELYVYSYAKEDAIGETTNLHRLSLIHNFNPYKAVRLKTAYHLLWAAQDTQGSTSIFNGGSHTFRGQLLTCWLTYSCCKQVRAHIVAEYFMPGNYYAEDYRGQATFVRANLEYTW